MHPYGTDSKARRIVPFGVAVVAVGATWLTSASFGVANIELPWWIQAPSTMSIYGLVYWLFDRYMWRWSSFRRLRIVRVPDLEGVWKGEVRSSYDEHADVHEVEVRIRQRWRSMSIRLRSEQSRSYSHAATLYLDAPEGEVLTYQFQNEPLPEAVDTMEIHRGTARLVVSAGDRMEGDYYSGRGRLQYGSLRLERKDDL